MLKSCSYCNRIHHKGFICSKKPSSNKKGNDIDKFRWSKPWQRKREHIKERDRYRCQICLLNKYDTQIIHNTNNIEVHHIIPIVEDWDKRLDDDNLISLCKAHHELAERGVINRLELKQIVLDIPPG